jgi:hypothetical protein
MINELSGTLEGVTSKDIDVDAVFWRAVVEAATPEVGSL